MNNSPIGVFDSGLGGLTAVKELELLLPNESIIYFGDTGRVPYGTKSKETIIKYASQSLSFLKSHGVKAVLAACGTVSSVAGVVRENADIPYFDVLYSTSKAALSATKNGKIGVIATPATIASGAYSKILYDLSSDIEIFEQACPLFVPLVECGHIGADDKIASLAVESCLEPIKKQGVDTLILGCTHFPMLSPIISRFMGENVSLINSGKEAAISLADKLREDNLLSDAETSENSYFVTDSADNFISVAENFLGHSISGHVEKIDIEKY